MSWAGYDEAKAVQYMRDAIRAAAVLEAKRREERESSASSSPAVSTEPRGDTQPEDRSGLPESYPKWLKPPRPHNHLLAPGVCMCIDCSIIVAGLRCTAVSEDGHRCGDYKHHRGAHTLLVCSTFMDAEARAALKPAAAAVSTEPRGDTQ